MAGRGDDDGDGSAASSDPLELRVTRLLDTAKHDDPGHEPCSADDSADFPSQAGPLTLDQNARTVQVDGRELDLTAKEHDLLAIFLGSPRRVLTRADLLAAVWQSNDTWQTAATVTEHVYRLRGKLERAGVDPRCIRTLRSYGYVYDPSVFQTIEHGSADPHAALRGEAPSERSEWRGMFTAIESLLSTSKSDRVREWLIESMVSIGEQPGSDT